MAPVSLAADTGRLAMMRDFPDERIERDITPAPAQAVAQVTKTGLPQCTAEKFA